MIVIQLVESIILLHSGVVEASFTVAIVSNLVVKSTTFAH